MDKKLGLKKSIVKMKEFVLIVVSTFSNVSLMPVVAQEKNVWERETGDVETTTKYVKVDSVNELSGKYVVVMQNIHPTTGVGANQSGLSVAAKTSYLSGYEENLDYAIFNAEDNESCDGLVWEIQSYGSGYSIKADGSSSYLRIDGSELTLGEAQALKIEKSGSYFNIYNGSNYIRFTNSFNSKSCYTAGTGSSSRDIVLYKVVKTESTGPGPTQPPEVEIAPPEGDPIFTLAAISDIHTDAGIQEWDDPLREDVYTTTQAIRENEDANVLLLGGDLTSAHMGGSWGSNDEEKKENFIRAQKAIEDAAESATESHRVLYATGNHEFAVGKKNFNSGDYIDATEKYLPGMVDAVDVNDTDANAYFQRTMPEGTGEDVRHVLAYHYNIDGMNFIVLNTPYTGEDNHSNYAYDEDSLRWVANKMDDIGKENTVFFIAHYPLNTDKNVTPGKGVNAATQTILKEEILDNYPNAVYLYGHDHGGYKIKFDTYERVTTYDDSGKSVDNKYETPSGFVSSFVGSMSYYGNDVNPTSLGSASPDVVQGLLVYVYNDRIVFQMKNYGEKDLGSYVLKEYTLMRDMKLDLDGHVDSVSLDRTALDLKVGETARLSANVLPETAPVRTVSWSSDNKSVAMVDENGLVTAVGPGSATITAASVDAGKTAGAFVKVTWQPWQQALQDLIDNVKQVMAGDMNKYTPESVDALSKALASAEKVLTGGGTQAEVDNAKASLQAALDGLVLKASDIDSPGNSLLAKGEVFTTNGVLQFEVTKSDAKSGTVTVTKLLKNKAAIIIPSMVEKNGYTYKVTAINKNVFQKNKKIKSITIGANVKTIGKNAFFKCSKLKAIIFKGMNAPKIGKDAFKKINVKANIEVPKKMKKKQFNLLKKRMKSAGKKVTYIKK